MTKLTLITDKRAEKISKLLDILKDLVYVDDVKDLYSLDYHLTENVDKPYYILCYWDSGSNGFFGDKNDVLERVMDILDRPTDEHYWVRIIDVKSGVIMKPVVKDIDLVEDPIEYETFSAVDYDDE
jgi:hypothetical protein